MFCAERFVTIRHLPMVFNRLSVSSRSELILNNAIVSEEFNEIWKEKRKAKSCKLFASHQNLRCIKEKKIYFYRIFFHENVNMKRRMFFNVPSGSWENMETHIETDVDISGLTEKIQNHSADFFLFRSEDIFKKIVERPKLFCRIF